MRSDLPTGTVTFLFTDIEGSTQLIHAIGDQYADALAEHHRLLRAVWAQHAGVEVDSAGDAFFVAFGDPARAVRAAVAAQQALRSSRLRVRMGLHTGEPQVAATGYVGLVVHTAARIAAAAHGGQILASAATSELVSERWRDLGLHRLKDLAEPIRLFQAGDVEFPPLRTLYASNLPVQPTPLVGREREVSELGALVRSGARLVTLTGPGGTGKTRLALQAAAELTGDFRDGVWLVSLGAVVDDSLVLPTIAQTIGVRGDLLDELRQKQLLLVLDNLEQVLDAAPEIALLLAGAPDLAILATSRERLDVAAEHEYAVEPLPHVDAASLFGERARRLDPSFEPDESVLELVRRLEGMPLAIELAAARIKLLSPRQIVERLGESLDLLSGGRDRPERQRTLRRTIEWSYDLLSPGERGLFGRLGVFAGSFSLEAAETIAHASLAELAALVDKSMLLPAEPGRYSMLETIRSFAAERLEPGLRDAHAAFYASTTSEIEPGLRDHRQREVIRRLTLDQPNIRAALDRLEAAEDAGPQCRLVAVLAYYWYLTGQVHEGIARLEHAYSRTHPGDRHRGPVANGLAGLLFMTGDRAGTARFANEAWELTLRHDDVAGQLRALVGKQMGSESTAECRELVQRQIDLAREAGDRWYLALGLCNAGVFEREAGNLEGALELILEAGAAAAELGDPHLAIACASNAAQVELRLGRLDAAEARYIEALELLRLNPLFEMAIWCLEGLAAVAIKRGDAEHGGRLLGGAEALAASNAYAHPENELYLGQTQAALEAAVGVERASVLLAEGEAMEVSELVDLALGRS